MSKKETLFNSIDALNKHRNNVKSLLALRNEKSHYSMADGKYEILICGGTGCTSSGGAKVVDALNTALVKHEIADKTTVITTGCHGFCEQGPLIIVYPGEIFYVRVTEEDAEEIVTETILKHQVIPRLLFRTEDSMTTLSTFRDVRFYNRQKRLVLQNCGHINPENLDEYIASGGYEALEKTLNSTPDAVLDTMKEAGLRGRGGGGFPTAIKWEATKKAEKPKDGLKYVVCNADEGDPGAFMDRSVLEGDPHKVLEGMLIAAYVVGASEGYVYVRAEYPLAITRLNLAIEQAKRAGLMGDNILGSNFSCTIKVKEGAGAFVCGEETALLNSIEGKRGMPRPRPPFPAQKGLWDMPTVLNNVETFANVPLIIRHGSEWYSNLGTEKSRGTKVFALTGKVNNTGLVEVPMGITMREIIFDIGGGILDNKKFKAVQIGGPSGGCLPEHLLDSEVDYDSLIAAGAMMGSGGLVVVDEDTCMVDFAKFFLTFTQAESCGKCTPCREGTYRMLEVLERITSGLGKEGDIERLEEMAIVIKNSALCGLGQTAPNPILSTLRYFRNEYESHIKDKSCPAHACSALTKYYIEADKCIGCTLCSRVCPANAVIGELKKPHSIDMSLCVRCGSCIKACKKNKAIKRV